MTRRETAGNPWWDVRCIFESPILDERKWSKVPQIPADAFILDLEDAVPAPGKIEARGKVLEYLGRPEYFGGRLTVARPNGLDTPWGRDDVLALAEAKAPVLMLAKVDSTDDLDEVLELCAQVGHQPLLLPSIESAAAVLHVESIFSHPSVVAATFGAGDLHVDAGMALYEPDGTMNPGLLYPKVKTSLAGSACGVPVFGIAYAPDIKDLDEIRARTEADQRLGFDGACAFYPPHVAIVNETFSPSPEAVASAEETVALYESAVAAGRPAVQRANGEAVLMHQYQSALQVLARARAYAPSTQN